MLINFEIVQTWEMIAHGVTVGKTDKSFLELPRTLSGSSKSATISCGLFLLLPMRANYQKRI